jgi:uncharacterized SAM-binding protein YcdF (DUF218 family)
MGEHFAGCPLILQGELDDAARMADGLAAAYRIDSHRQAGKYLDTREFLAQAADIMQREKWRTAVLVAQPYHVPRVLAAARKMGIEISVPANLPAAWEPASAQWWTRSAGRWRAREGLAILTYWLRGWL